jgi:hypothetical protein
MVVLIGLAGRAFKNGEFVGTARVGKDEVTKTLNENGIQSQAFAYPLKRAAQILFGLSYEETWNDKLKEVKLNDWDLSPRQIFQRFGTEGGRNVFGENIWSDLFSKKWLLMVKGKSISDSAAGTTFVDPIFECALRMMGVDENIAMQSQTLDMALPGFPWTMNEVMHKIKTETIPAVMQLSDQSYQRWSDIRSTRPFIKENETPYPIIFNPKGMVALDSRFENEANIVRSLGGSIIHIERNLPDDMPIVTGHSSEKGIAIHTDDIVIKNDGSLDDLRYKVIQALKQIYAVHAVLNADCQGLSS